MQPKKTEEIARDEMSSRASSTSSGRRATRELFLCSTATSRRRNESDDSFLARVTHLRLQNKGLSSLGVDDVFRACPSLKVLYLYDNSIESLEGLKTLDQLEQLYVDNNYLWSVQGTFPCQRLTKLHLSGNSIRHLCGLEEARCLEELYVARQRIPPGEHFSFDEGSINGIKDSLLVLDASGNSMREEELGTVLHLYGLETLHLANNDIKDIPQVIDIMTSMEDLRECDLRGNAVRRKPKYFEKVVTRCSERLEMLDGKPVHPQHRSMLKRLDRHKKAEARRSAARSNPSAPTPAPIAEHGISISARGATVAAASIKEAHGNSNEVNLPFTAGFDDAGRYRSFNG